MSATTNLANGASARIIGIDLAWGEKNPDGLCLIRASRERSVLVGSALTAGDDELMAWLDQHAPPSEATLLVIDAPLIIPNATGSRPVDRQTTSLFGKNHAGCYPANSGKCARPLRVVQRLQEHGYAVGFDLRTSSRMAAEVYPHPAMIRLFELDLTIKYKKGAVAAKRQEFKRLQGLIKDCLNTRYAGLEVGAQILTLLDMPWKKSIEDQTDALFCSLIGYHHWLHRGIRSEVIGDLATGFILLPTLLG